MFLQFISTLFLHLCVVFRFLVFSDLSDLCMVVLVALCVALIKKVVKNIFNIAMQYILQVFKFRLLQWDLDLAYLLKESDAAAL